MPTKSPSSRASPEGRAEGSDLSDLRAESRAKALGSFSFYARRVLGLRALRVERCIELQQGASPKGALERSALDGWLGLQTSEVKRGPLWLLNVSSAEGASE
jgi:hypothetical protein